MPFELNFKNIFQDFNPSKFLVYGCLLVFCLLYALRQDTTILWSYWVVFLPLWVWKCFVISGSVIGSWVWWRHPHYRIEGDAYVQYKAMVIATGTHLLLLMFELLACDKLEKDRDQVLWILVFIPLICLSIISIGICVWAVKHDRTFELELFCAVNILQFIFLALRLDEFITWKWVIVFIPVWIVMCIAMIAVLYAIILAVILLKSPDIMSPEQRRGNVFSAVGYTCVVVPLLVFEILFVNKMDGVKDYSFIEVTIPLLVSLLTLMLMAFGSRTCNHWWFGLRRDFCPWLLGICPLLQEYGNISYKTESNSPNSEELASSQTKQCHHNHTRKGTLDDLPKTAVPILSIEMPD